MDDVFYLGAYWGSRPENLYQISNKIYQTLMSLRQLDIQFGNWYERGMTKKQALEKKISLTPEYIETLCLKGIKRSELNDKGFVELGFLVGLWSGHADDYESSSISFNVGGKFDTDSLSNCCVIDFPARGEARERLLQLEKVKETILMLVGEWNPDYAILSSRELRDKLNVGNEIGWVTYRKTVSNNLKNSNKIIQEKMGDGHLFHLNSENNYDYNMVNELKNLGKQLKIK